MKSRFYARIVGLVIGLMAFAHFAVAADLGGATKPAATAVVAAANPADAKTFNGCYVDASLAGHYFRALGAKVDVTQYGIGLGCDRTLGRSVVVGGGIGFDLGDGERLASAYGRVGYKFNPHLLGYGFLSYDVDASSGLKVRDGMALAGVGLETYVGDQVTLFAQAGRDVAQIGNAKLLDDIYVFRAGVRLHFDVSNPLGR